MVNGKGEDKNTEGLTPRQKAAIVMIALGPDVSAQIYKNLKKEEVELLTAEISKLGPIMPDVRDAVLEHFYRMFLVGEQIEQGGSEYAQEILKRSFGTHKASEFINHLDGSEEKRPFRSIESSDPEQLLNLIQNEHPQTIALILNYLKPEKSASLLLLLPKEKQIEVSMRMATMNKVIPEVVEQVEKVVERKLSSFHREGFHLVSGIESLAEILNRVERSTEHSILAALNTQNPELAEEVKKRMFVFEDIVNLRDRDVQEIMRNVDSKEIPYILKGTNEEVQTKVLKNISEHLRDLIREDMEVMGPVRLKKVEEAQQKVVDIIRDLEEKEKIIIAKGREEEILI